MTRKTHENYGKLIYIFQLGFAKKHMIITCIVHKSKNNFNKSSSR